MAAGLNVFCSPSHRPPIHKEDAGTHLDPQAFKRVLIQAMSDLFVGPPSFQPEMLLHPPPKRIHPVIKRPAKAWQFAERKEEVVNQQVLLQNPSQTAADFRGRPSDQCRVEHLLLKNELNL